MKVVNISPVLFKAKELNKNSEQNTITYPQIKELGSTTPDFAVQIPQKYNSLGVSEFSNGLKIYSYKLSNGHRVTIIPMEGSPAIVKNYVNVGSMNETDDIKGISHFLEHMAFNGTTGDNGYIKLGVGDSFKKIDKLGGWTNASTNYALTDYVNSTPLLEEKDLEEQIRIIAGMTENLALSPEMIEKEKGPVCSEINMIMDNPQTILMDQTVRTLFNVKSSADELVGGSTRHIKDLTKEKVQAYYDKYYTPNNMNLVITGDVNPQKTIELVAKNFKSNKKHTGRAYETQMRPIQHTVRKDFITEKATSAEIMLGFAGPKNNDTKAKIIFDILSEHLGSTDLGLHKELKEINANNDFGIEKISTNPNNNTMIFYALNSSEENSEKALKIIFNKFSKLKAPDEKNLNIIKERLIQSYKNGLEYSSLVNNVIGNSIIDGEFDAMINYEKIIESITVDDINNFIRDYLNLDKTAITLVHPQTSIDNIRKNHSEANKLTFKGKNLPININKIQEETLNNNYKIGYYKTDSDNMYFDINLRFDIPQNTKPAVREVLCEILDMGTLQNTEDNFRKIQENNNINISAELSPQKLNIAGYSSKDNFIKTVNLAKEILYSPRITDKEVNTAINRLKDYLNRKQDSAFGIYSEFESTTNPLHTSNAQLLKDLDSVTTSDVIKLHEYIMKNSVGTVAVNIPNKCPEIKSIAQNSFESLVPVNEYKYKREKVFSANDKTNVLIKEKNVSQADITEVFKFKIDDSPREQVLLEIAKILLSSSSIGLFNTLREKEQLAYSVYADIDRLGDCAEFSCNILTTTDNKDLGEQSYDNVQKSINGFNRQIDALLNSDYTDDDLESAKRILKAKLLNKEGTPNKLYAINKGLDSKYGLDYENKLFNEIDKITRADIKNFTQKAFKYPPTYAIVASKDTLNANKDFFETL